MQALGSLYTVRHASTGTSMGCVYYFLTACSNTSHASTWKGLQYQFQSRSVSCSRLASVATSTFSKLPCFARWLACEDNQCQTLVSVLAPKRKITQVFTLPSGVWFTSTHTHTHMYTHTHTPFLPFAAFIPMRNDVGQVHCSCVGVVVVR